MELCIDRLTKQYGHKLAVDRVDLELHQGVYGLLGANGAGKTTLMRMLCDILTPTSGEIRYNGREIGALGEDYRSCLGYLPQNFGYYPEFTAEKFLLYLAALKGLGKIQAGQKMLELLDLVGLAEERKHKIRTFSGGMKQRLGIAQALLNDPEILILDEPTAGLDPKERVRFRNMISSLGKERIVLLSTHIVSDVDYIADQIMIMKQGRIICQGTQRQLADSVGNMVWKCTVSERDVEYFSEEYIVSNIKKQGEEAELRIVSEKKPVSNAVRQEASLEDIYLYLTRNTQEEGR